HTMFFPLKLCISIIVFYFCSPKSYPLEVRKEVALNVLKHPPSGINRKL
ncbi:MAG: hypothetical protein ACI93S_001465, partial [Ancylomarina sp.]